MNRLETLMAKIPDVIDAVMISSMHNRRYYTGFASTAGTVIATREKSRFLIDSRYYEAARATVKDTEVILQDKLYEQLSEIMKANGVKTLAVEGDSVTLDGCRKLKEKLPDIEISDDCGLSGLISRQRSVKSADELEDMAAAQAIAEKTFKYILTVIKPGVTEKEIELTMEFFSRQNGSEKAAFPFIVASGPNSALPHAVPGGRKIEKGDFITMDFGCTVNGYRSDMTRTVAVGGVSEKQREVYSLVLKAQAEAMKAIRPGAAGKDVDAIARDLIDASPYKGLFGHGLGHSLGLAIHEPPRFSKDEEEIIESGMVLSVEPGVYLPGEFGVRIEDVIVVTDTGCRNMTACDKSLLVI